MAKLYFYYSAMNAGKSTVLLQSAYNYNERGMDTILLTPAIDKRFGENKITSRIGLDANAFSFNAEYNLFQHVKEQLNKNDKIKCVLVDEAQFLTKQQVMQLVQVVDTLDIPVLTYGIRSDFRAEPFPGSQYLLVWADNLIEIKTICFCGKKAIMNARMDANGQIVRTGEQIQIGGNEKYVAMCRKHFNSY
jgi:thymidine kinase